MEFVAGDRSIFIGSKDDEVFTGCDVDVREGPLGKIGRIIGEAPVCEADGFGVRIMDFNPIGSVAVFIGDAGGIARKEFGDDWACLKEGKSEEERGENPDEVHALRSMQFRKLKGRKHWSGEQARREGR